MATYFEDLALGLSFTSAGRTVTETDIVNFAGVSGDFNQLHTNAEWVRANTTFARPIAHGLLVLSISSGLSSPGLDDLTILAYLNVERAMKAPVMAGETIHVQQVIVDVRTSSSGKGLVTLEVQTVKSDGTVVQSGTDLLLVAPRPVVA